MKWNSDFFRWSITFNIRVKQLQRRIIDSSDIFGSVETKSLVEDIKKKISQDTLNLLYGKISQIDLLGNIYSRAISKIATEEMTEEGYYQLYTIIKICELLIIEICDAEIQYPLDYSIKFTLNSIKFQKIQEQIRPIKKERNQSLTTIEDIINYILATAKADYSHYNETNSWNEILSYIFGIDISDATKGAKKIEQVNIKEQILYNQFYGPLITDISYKYDGLITYTMSLLTMVATTDYSEEFSGRLSGILDKLGSSTQITLLQSRLLNIVKRKEKIEAEFCDLFEKIKKVNTEKINVDYEKNIKEIAKQFSLPEFTYETTALHSVDELVGIKDLFSNPELQSYHQQIDNLWIIYNEIYGEIHSTLLNLNEYFNSIIKNANDITANLFAKGFQAGIPMYDVEICERAGIHIKNITATTSTMKSQISDDAIDLKLKLLREMENRKDIIRKILQKKAQEEETTNNISSEFLIFNNLFTLFNKSFSTFASYNIFSSFPEEAPLTSRILVSIISIQNLILKQIYPIKSILFNIENIEIYRPRIRELQKYYQDFENLSKLIILLSNIAKKMWQLNRNLVIKFGENLDLNSDGTEIIIMMQDVPEILKREFQQRLIPAEERKRKLQIHKEIEELIKEIFAHKSEVRYLFVDYLPDEFRKIFSNPT